MSSDSADVCGAPTAKALPLQGSGRPISEQLGRLEGMAINYGNLGGVSDDRGDASAARELWTKSRDLYARIGMPHKVAEVQRWLDGLENPPKA